MIGFNSAPLLISSVCVVLTLVMLVILLWQDQRSTTNIAFAALVAMTTLWTGGALVSRMSAYVGGPPSLTAVGVRLLEFGFTGACAALYLFALVLTGAGGRRLMRLAVFSVALLLTYQIVIAVSGPLPAFAVRDDGALLYGFTLAGALLYAAFSSAAMLTAWQRGRKVKSGLLLIGIYGFGAGILLELISPELRSRAFGLTLSALALLVVGYAMLRAQIIDPLAGRAAQLQAVRDVGLAITSRLRLEDVLQSIAEQAKQILQADGAAIFLKQGATLELAAEANMSRAFRGHRLALGEGLAGQVAVTRQAQRLDDYRRDWAGHDDVPFAKEGFGAVVAAPLVAGEEVMGVLLVAEGVAGKRFDREDMALLELLGPQAAVAIANSRLYEGQRHLADELAATTEQLRHADKLKDQMLQMTSHQLKNPLFVAMSSLELLREEQGAALATVVQDDLATIWEALERMERIISTVLNLERIRSGALLFTECHLADLARGVVTDLSQDARRGGVALHSTVSNDLPPLAADRGYLVQALANLVENAVKFTPPGGQVTLSATAAEGAIIVQVADTGVGIPPEALSRVFEAFFRARQPGVDHVGGTGLGLSLVAAVINAHNGRVWVESEVGRGTTFFLALPLRQPDTLPRAGLVV